MIEMHISEIGFCSGHSASGVWVNERGETTVPGLYAAGDMACVPHNYMLGAFVYGRLAGENAADYVRGRRPAGASTRRQIEAERGARARAAAARGRPHRPPGRVQGAAPGQRLPAAAEGHRARWSIGLERFAEVARRPDQLVAPRPARADARDGGALRSATAPRWPPRASLYRTESRWGLYHLRVDYPETDDDELVLPHPC